MKQETAPLIVCMLQHLTTSKLLLQVSLDWMCFGWLSCLLAATLPLCGASLSVSIVLVLTIPVHNHQYFAVCTTHSVVSTLSRLISPWCQLSEIHALNYLIHVHVILHIIAQTVIIHANGQKSIWKKVIANPGNTSKQLG